ncbi:MAG: RbsD/FucU domain-containing protein [Terracidiphilus sp.]|nr:RbsD/FucU domain-containing protein [Terracidiphilus sp.]
MNPTDTPPEWERQFRNLLPLYGHRNWIVVADAAYPAQSKPGIDTVVANDEQIPVVRTVLDAIAATPHVRARIYADRELAFVAENDAPGVADYRRELAEVLAGHAIETLPHEEIIHKLDQSAELFRILILKTDMTIPYTSVFFELDCGYWNAEAEQRLRQAILAADSR